MMGLGRKTKGIKLLTSVYPEDNSPVLHSNLEALIKYALMNPQKLSEIGKYIEKRVIKDLSKARYR